jgi:hypothetical protein
MVLEVTPEAPAGGGNLTWLLNAQKTGNQPAGRFHVRVEVGLGEKRI